MASSNRHWPSMFKSKPCNQWQHDVSPSLLSNGCHRPPFSSGGEERSPEPKPRWNPKPEQIRILEAIFNSGMVNPPRDEIRRIRAQLQEYGQVGDANVFYWFQNRKSRSKHKQRQLQTATKHNNQTRSPTTAAAATATTVPSSSSSSSDKSSPKSAEFIPFSLGPGNVVDMANSPTASVNQTFFQTSGSEFLPEPFFFPVSTGGMSTQSGYCYPEMGGGGGGVHLHDQTAGNNCSGFLLSDLLMNHGPTKKDMMMMEDDHEKLKLLQEEMNFTAVTAAATSAPTTTTHSFVPPHSSITVPSTTNHILGVGIGETPLGGLAKSTVFINDVAFEVSVGPFNVREAFGDDVVLINSSGQPVLTNAWGVTLQSLQHGGIYYLIRTLAPVSSSAPESHLIWYLLSR